MMLPRRVLVVCCFVALFPLLMGAVTITIDNPASGSGATWDCSIVDGTTTGCANGSPVYGAIYKKVNGDWSMDRPLGPLYVTATNLAGTWTTQPDFSLMVGNSFTASGDYKVKVTVMDNPTMVTDIDENTWTVP